MHTCLQKAGVFFSPAEEGENGLKTGKKVV
jgi:hypothetical protein